MARSEIIDTPAFPTLDWQEQDVAAQLTKVYDYARKTAESALSWYEAHHPAKRKGGVTLRVFAIVLGLVGVVIPILAELVTDDGTAVVAPGWSAVAFALAAGFVTLDKFWGFTSGWMRFITAEQEIKGLLEDFHFDWQARCLICSAPPTREQVGGLLDLARAFAQRVDKVVADETHSWIIEFRSGLAATERQLRADGR